MKPANQKLLDDIWKSYVKIYRQEGEFEGFNATERGMYVAKSERDKLKDIMIEIIRNTLVPQAEKKFKYLYARTHPKKKYGGFFSKEVASTLPVDNKVFYL